LEIQLYILTRFLQGQPGIEFSSTEVLLRLQNRYFQLTIIPKTGSLNLHPRDKSFPSIIGSTLAIHYSQGHGSKVEALDQFKLLNPINAENSKEHGKIQTIRYTSDAKNSHLKCRITFALVENYPLFLWKIEVRNKSSAPIYIDKIEMLNIGAKEYEHSQLKFPLAEKSDIAFYSNGWQSWAYSGVYSASQSARRTRLGPFQLPQNTNPTTPRSCKKGHFSSDFFGLIGDRFSRKGLIVGFLSQKQHFGVIETAIKAHPILKVWASGDHTRLNPDSTMVTDWAVLTPFSMDEVNPLDVYLDAVAREHHLKDFGQLSVGWCSWYQYYSKVTAAQIKENLLALKKLDNQLPLKLFQIDDGYQRKVGDWLTFQDTFPDGLETLVKEIKKAGYQPGIWMAPFIVHPRSELRRNHPDWLLHKESGGLVNSGFAWNTFNLSLDLTNTQALQYAVKVVHTAAHQWKFPYIKLDFLYAAARLGKYQDDTLTRAQVLRMGLEKLKIASGDETLLLGCGLPLGSGIGLVSIMRIGADVLENWYPKFFGISSIFRREPYMPAARNSIQNSLTRSFMHRKWWINDPDCLLVRPTSDLTLKEVQSLATVIGMTGGNVLLSDDLSQLPAERIKLVASLLPPIDQRPWVMDWFDAVTPSRLRLDLKNSSGKWQVLALFNWADKSQIMEIHPSDFKIPAGRYWVRSFWKKETWMAGKGHPLFSGDVAAHEVVLLAVRPVIPGKAQYLGSDLHISQGLEVKEWKVNKTGMNLTIELNRDTKGEIELALPHPPHKVLCNKKEIQWTESQPGCYRFILTVKNTSNLKIAY
jgi:alpha-galactosidase